MAVESRFYPLTAECVCVCFFIQFLLSDLCSFGVPATTLCPIGTTSCSISTKPGHEATAWLNILLFHLSYAPSPLLFLPLTLFSLSSLFLTQLFFPPPVLSASAVCFHILPVSLRLDRFLRSRVLPDARVKVRILVSATPQMGPADCRKTAGLTNTAKSQQEIGSWPTTFAASDVLSEFKMHGGWVLYMADLFSICIPSCYLCLWHRFCITKMIVLFVLINPFYNALHVEMLVYQNNSCIINFNNDNTLWTVLPECGTLIFLSFCLVTYYTNCLNNSALVKALCSL